MVVDHEKVVQDVKEHLQSKDSHGRRELLVVIAESEARHTIKEGVTERALRVASNRISHELSNQGIDPTSEDAVGVGANRSTV